MSVIRELTELLHIDEPAAERVRHEMDANGIDYSECSVREFNRAAREAHDTLIQVRTDMGDGVVSNDAIIMRAAESVGWRWSAKHQGFINENVTVGKTSGASSRGVRQTRYRVAATADQACFISGISSMETAAKMVSA